MPSLPFFSTLAELEENQGTPWVTINAMNEGLAKKMAAMLSKAITSADVTLTATEAETATYIRVTGTFTASRNLIVPAVSKFFVVEHSGTAHTLTVKTPSGTGVTMDPGTTVVVFCDGTNVVPVTSATGSGGGIYDLSFGIGDGLLPDGGIIGIFNVVRPIRLTQNLVNSASKADVGPDDMAQSITIKKNGSTIGTIDFALHATVPTYTFAADIDFAHGDVITWVAPSPADSALAGVSGTHAGIRL